MPRTRSLPSRTLPRLARALPGLLPRLVTLLGVLALLVLAVGAMTSSRQVAPPVSRTAPPTQAPPAGVVTVTTVPASVRALPRAVHATGTIAATDLLTVGAEANGLQIESVRVDEGSVVRKGDVLATLDSSILRAQLEGARARLAEAQATLARSIQPNRPEEIASQQASVTQALATASSERATLRQAQATLANDETNLLRYQQLYSQGYATTQETQNAQTAAARSRAGVVAQQRRVEAAEQATEAARQRLQLLQAGGRAEDVRIAQAQAQQAAASIHQLEAQLDQAVVRAPDDALVIRRDAHIGDITSAQKSLFTMVRQGRLELRAEVPEADLAGVAPGQPAQITTATGRFQGTVLMVTPAVDPQTRLGTIRIRVPSRPGIRTGMFARAVIQAGRARAVVVPVAAVQGSEDDRFVFVLKPVGTTAGVPSGQGLRQGVAARREIRTGRTSGSVVEVVSGLSPGEPVVVAGAGFLEDGDVVRVK